MSDNISSRYSKYLSSSIDCAVKLNVIKNILKERNEDLDNIHDDTYYINAINDVIKEDI